MRPNEIGIQLSMARIKRSRLSEVIVKIDVLKTCYSFSVLVVVKFKIVVVAWKMYVSWHSWVYCLTPTALKNNEHFIVLFPSKSSPNVFTHISLPRKANSRRRVFAFQICTRACLRCLFNKNGALPRANVKCCCPPKVKSKSFQSQKISIPTGRSQTAAGFI